MSEKEELAEKKNNLEKMSKKVVSAISKEGIAILDRVLEQSKAKKTEYHEVKKEEILKCINSCLIIDLDAKVETMKNGYIQGKNGECLVSYAPGKITLTIELLKENKN